MTIEIGRRQVILEKDVHVKVGKVNIDIEIVLIFLLINSFQSLKILHQ